MISGASWPSSLSALLQGTTRAGGSATGADDARAPNTPRGIARVRSAPRTFIWRAVALGMLAASAVLAFVFFRGRDARLAAARPGATPSAATARRAVVNSPPSSVAVLPFVFLGEDSARAFRAAAVADALTGTLARVQGLRVASRTVSGALQRRLALGDTSALPVRTLVEGVVEEEGAAVRVSVRLVSAEDGFTLWADRFDGTAATFFAMEDALADALSTHLREHFHLQTAPEHRSPSVSGTARPG